MSICVMEKTSRFHMAVSAWLKCKSVPDVELAGLWW